MNFFFSTPMTHIMLFISSLFLFINQAPATSCNLCKSSVYHLDSLINSSTGIGLFKSALTEACKLFPEKSMDIVGKSNNCQGKKNCDILCKGMIDEFIGEFIYIATKTTISPQDVCSLIKLCPKIPHKPYIVPNNTLINSNTTDYSGEPHFNNWNNNTGLGKFIQITDIHLDIYYKQGYHTNCGLPICCRPDSNSFSNDNVNISNKWGSPYGKCDIPISLLKSVLNFTSNNIDNVDSIFLTGDGPPHDIWEQSRRYNLNVNDAIRTFTKYYFPNTSVFPIIGNHDTFPINQEPGLTQSDWLYKNLSMRWKYWFSNDSLNTFNFGGFYTQRVKPGFRIIGLNTNVYPKENWWQSLYNKDDYGHQLAWLRDVLNQSKVNQEKVIILAHHSPNNWYSKEFIDYYTNLLLEYSDIIEISIYGHQHSGPSLRLFYNNSVPKSFGIVGGSLTTYTELNPTFTVYIYNRTTNEIIDFEIWWADLINISDDINWVMQYKFLERHNINSLNPIDLDIFAKSLLTNKTNWENYKNDYYRNISQSDGGKTNIELYCEIISLNEEEYKVCLNNNI